MTAPSLRTPLPVDDVDTAIEALRLRGLRISAARRLVLEALFVADAPMTADAVAAGVAGRVPRSDLGSVYRNLEVLEQVGVVRHVHLGHGPGLYALAREPESEYLVCESCDAVRAVPAAALDGVRDEVRAAFGWDARFSHFPIVGLCPDCGAESAARGESHEGAERHAHP